MIPYLGEFQSTKLRDFAILASSVILGVICVLLPILASLVINGEWQLKIPFTDVTYKPWRLFMLLSGFPNLLTGISIYFFPESPKFLSVAQRNYAATHSSGFEPSIWKQTSSLISKKYLKLTISICIIHFFVFAVGGMGSWFPEIVNSVTTFIKENKTETSTLCDIFGNKHNLAGNSTESCVEKFELSTYSFVILSESMFVIVMLSFSIAVRWISKTVLLSKCNLNIGLVLNDIFQV